MKPLSSFSQSRIDLITCVSKDIINQYKALLKNCRYKCVHNIFIDNFPERLKLEAVENPSLANKKKPVFIVTGMLEKWKGLDTFLKAFAKLNERIDSHLIILGEG